jgi:hypothetical protein
MAAGAIERLSDRGPSGIASDSRFQTPFVSHIATVGADFRSLSESAGAGDCVRGPRVADAQIAGAREAVRCARPARRLCAQPQRKV